MSEFNAALTGMNSHTVGKDRIHTKMFPTSTKGKDNFLKAINNEIYSSRKLHFKLLHAKLTFVEKKDNSKTGKLRPISVTCRVACLMDKLVSNRLDKLLKHDENFKNRYGFKSHSNIEQLTADLLEQNMKDRKDQDL